MRRLLMTLAVVGLSFVWPTHAAETVKHTALSAVTSGTSVVYALNNRERVGLQVTWATGVTAGVVVLETAPTMDYGGTWDTAITLDVAAATTPPSAQSDAVDICAAYARVRVSTTVSGGGSPSVTAYILLQGAK